MYKRIVQKKKRYVTEPQQASRIPEKKSSYFRTVQTVGISIITQTAILLTEFQLPVLRVYLRSNISSLNENYLK